MPSSSTVVIAGFGPGLGEALQQRFELGGYQVAGVSRQGDARWATDLRSPEATQALFQRLDAQMPPLAGVIHNAMAFHREAFMKTHPDDLQAVWQSMVLTAFNTSQAAIPRLMARGGGSLIFSGASGSLRAGPGFSAFSSAKFALRGLSQAIAREHGPDGIHVAHVVIDGLIASDKTRQRFGERPASELIEPQALAEHYWQLFHQPASAWSQETDIRPAPQAPARTPGAPS